MDSQRSALYVKQKEDNSRIVIDIVYIQRSVHFMKAMYSIQGKYEDSVKVDSKNENNESD